MNGKGNVLFDLGDDYIGCFFFFFFFFEGVVCFSHHTARGISVPRPGIELWPWH